MSDINAKTNNHPAAGDPLDNPSIAVLSDLGLPYVWLPFLIIDFYGPAISRAWGVYVTLTRLADIGTKEIVKHREDEIGDMVGQDRKTVREQIKRLEALGLVAKYPGDRANTNVYRLLRPVFPPPPEVVAEYFPDGWKPPKSALMALEKYGLATAYPYTQDMGVSSEEKNLGGKITHEEKGSQKTDTTVIEGKNSPNSGKHSPKNLDPRVKVPGSGGVSPHLINKQDNKTNQLSEADEEPFVGSLLESVHFKKKNETKDFDQNDMRSLWTRALNFFPDMPIEELKERVKDGVEVYLQTKKPTVDPMGYMWRMIEKGYSPRPIAPKKTIQSPIAQEIDPKPEESEKWSQYSVVQILEEFYLLRRVVSFKSTFDGLKVKFKNNPSWPEAEKEILKIEEGGK